MAIEPPSRGFVFWPVGTGDSTTIFVTDEVVVQVDLNHRSDADEDDTAYTPIIDELKEILPVRDDKPYLAVFALTHPDQDHCKGFERLLDEVVIGELWATPRVFREYKKDLCDDAKAFRTEMERRRDATVAAGGDLGAGDRVRIFGWDDLLQEDKYKGFPEDRLTIPGNELTEIDGEDYEGVFRAFVHAPFKDDSAGERNDTSLAMQVTLSDGEGAGRALLLGDLCYPTLRNVFNRSEASDLEWDVFLAPHHCSKSVMYWKGPDDEDEVRRQDILDDIEKAGGSEGWIVASSDVIPSSDQAGQNPPHAKAKRRYEEIAPTAFKCTQEHPTPDSPGPMIYEVTTAGIELRSSESQQQEEAHAGWSSAVEAARGSRQPPTEQVGFGQR